MRVYAGLFAILLLAALGRAEPAAAQECDPDVCANPWTTQGAKSRHRQKHIAKIKKPKKERPQYMRY